MKTTKRMKKRIRLPVLAVCLALAASSVLITCSKSNALATAGDRDLRSAYAAVSYCSEIYREAEPLYDTIRHAVLDDEEEASGDDIDFTGIEDGLREITECAEKLTELKTALSGLPEDMKTPEGKTVNALREYLTELINMASDITELGRYSVDLYRALEPLIEGEANDEDSFQFAVDLYDFIGTTQELLAKVNPPIYLKATHDDLVKQIEAFKIFSTNYMSAAYYEDPLLEYACLSRMNRITILFSRSDNNLNADMDLQTRQAKSRIEGPIKTLHDELNRNLGLLAGN